MTLGERIAGLRKEKGLSQEALCELAAHPDFPRLMADLEIYVNGTALKQAQGANAWANTRGILNSPS